MLHRLRCSTGVPLIADVGDDAYESFNQVFVLVWFMWTPLVRRLTEGASVLLLSLFLNK